MSSLLSLSTGLFLLVVLNASTSSANTDPHPVSDMSRSYNDYHHPEQMPHESHPRGLQYDDQMSAPVRSRYDYHDSQISGGKHYHEELFDGHQALRPEMRVRTRDPAMERPHHVSPSMESIDAIEPSRFNQNPRGQSYARVPQAGYRPNELEQSEYYEEKFDDHHNMVDPHQRQTKLVSGGQPVYPVDYSADLAKSEDELYALNREPRERSHRKVWSYASDQGRRLKPRLEMVKNKTLGSKLGQRVVKSSAKRLRKVAEIVDGMASKSGSGHGSALGSTHIDGHHGATLPIDPVMEPRLS